MKTKLKKTSLSLIVLTLFTLSVSGQDDAYTTAMKSALRQMDQSAEPDHYLDCASKFERIATAEKNKWLPYYYSSHCLALMSFQESEGGKRDMLLDRAQEMLDQALALAPDNAGESELHVLQAFIYPSRIMVDPMARGGIYFQKMFASLESAKKLNPENPRSFFLEGSFKLNTPAEMGGGAQAARPVLEEALSLYKTFTAPEPLWPIWGEDATRDELAKLSN